MCVMSRTSDFTCNLPSFVVSYQLLWPLWLILFLSSVQNTHTHLYVYVYVFISCVFTTVLWVKKEEEESGVWHHPLWHGICLVKNTISLIWDNKVILNLESTYIHTHVRACIDRQMQHTHTSTHTCARTHTQTHALVHMCNPSHTSKHPRRQRLTLYSCVSVSMQ